MEISKDIFIDYWKRPVTRIEKIILWLFAILTATSIISMLIKWV